LPVFPADESLGRIPEVKTPLPSWVPDWLAHDFSSAIVFCIMREKPFNASKGTRPIMYPFGEYGTDEGYISQIGYSLGKIARLSIKEEEPRTDGNGGAAVESASDERSANGSRH
jgi:hypothetical protein